jgi:hypothetical protein
VTGQRQQRSRIRVRSSRYDELHVEIGCLKRIDQVMKAFFGEAEYGLDDRRPRARQIDLQPVYAGELVHTRRFRMSHLSV